MTAFSTGVLQHQTSVHSSKPPCLAGMLARKSAVFDHEFKHLEDPMMKMDRNIKAYSITNPKPALKCFGILLIGIMAFVPLNLHAQNAIRCGQAQAFHQLLPAGESYDAIELDRLLGAQEDMAHDFSVDVHAATPMLEDANADLLQAVPAGGIFACQVQVQHQGHDFARNILIQSVLPEEMSPDSLFGFSPRPPDIVSGNMIAWIEQRLEAGDLVTYEYLVRAPQSPHFEPISLSNSFTVSYPGDRNSDNNSSTVEVIVVPPVAEYCSAFVAQLEQ